MADDDGCLTLLGIGLFIGLVGYSCSKEEKVKPAPPVPAAPISTTETNNAAGPVVVQPPPPAPNYDSREGRDYYYVASVSEEERRKGTVVGPALGYRYLGQNDAGEDTLYRLPNGPKIYCGRPCRVIRYEDGERLGFSPQSLIGSVFEDAQRGLLKPYRLIKTKPENESKPEAAEIPMDSISE